MGSHLHISAPLEHGGKHFLGYGMGSPWCHCLMSCQSDITVTSDASGSGAVNPPLGIMWLHASTVELWEPIQIDNHKGATSNHHGLACSYRVGEKIEGGCMQSYCDNQAVVAIIQSRYSRDNELMHLLHCLFFNRSHLWVPDYSLAYIKFS